MGGLSPRVDNDDDDRIGNGIKLPRQQKSVPGDFDLLKENRRKQRWTIMVLVCASTFGGIFFYDGPSQVISLLEEYMRPAGVR